MAPSVPKCTVSSFCCGCSLKTGAWITAIFTMFVYLYELGSSTDIAVHVHEDIPAFELYWVVFANAIAGMIAACILAYGIYKNIVRYIWINFYMQIVVTLVTLVVTTIAGIITSNIAFSVVTVIFHCVLFYLILIVRSYAIELETNLANRPSELATVPTTNAFQVVNSGGNVYGPAVQSGGNVYGPALQVSHMGGPAVSASFQMNRQSDGKVYGPVPNSNKPGSYVQHVGYQPPAANYQPPVGYYQPPSGSYQPPSGSFQPPSGSYQPPAASYQPPAASYQPPTASYQPPVGSYQPPDANYPPPGGNYQPPSGDYQSTSGVFQPPVGVFADSDQKPSCPDLPPTTGQSGKY